MNIKINQRLVSQTRWDSGAITPLASVIHCPGRLGPHQIIVLAGKNQERIALFDLSVDDKAAPGQLNIDLFAATKKGFSEESGFDEFVINPQSIIVFFASRGTEAYSVLIRKADGEDKTITFDSRALANGDYFLVSPLVSGMYRITSGRQEVGRVKVRKRSGRNHPDETALITCTNQGLEPKELETDFMQSIAIQVKSKKPCRFVMELVKDQDESEC